MHRRKGWGRGGKCRSHWRWSMSILEKLGTRALGEPSPPVHQHLSCSGTIHFCCLALPTLYPPTPALLICYFLKKHSPEFSIQIQSFDSILSSYVKPILAFQSIKCIFISMLYLSFSLLLDWKSQESRDLVLFCSFITNYSLVGKVHELSGNERRGKSRSCWHTTSKRVIKMSLHWPHTKGWGSLDD